MRASPLEEPTLNMTMSVQCTIEQRESSERADSIVLVAKALTKSDTAGRVILPRASVERNLCFVTGYR